MREPSDRAPARPLWAPAGEYAPAVELTPLRQFVAICAAGHMTRAARAVGVTQPALSAMVRKLEAEVGTALLHRTARGVEPTDAGRQFLRFAAEAVRSADAAMSAVRELSNLQAGSIRVGGGATATSYLLPPVVSAFRRQHPGLTFYVREAGSSAIAQAVATGELDLGIVTLPLTRQESAELLVTPLVDDELRLILPPRHAMSAARGGAPFRWRDLEGQPIIAFEAGSAVRSIIDDAARSAGVALNVVMELRSIESIKHMVAAGIGLGFVSRFALRPGEGVPAPGGVLTRRLALVRSSGRLPSAATAALAKMLPAAVLGRRGKHKQR